MLELRNIVKEYVTGDTKVTALRGINLRFRKNEFVAVLGASGCGKTTLLNIVGGLDRYTDGDLLIGGVSTKLFRDADWDSYRNHSVGFVFQSYNLIPHQSVLANVELALTLSGVSKAERRARAREALEKVGLGDQLNKKPNQMSGGQMQRVAIARALVNNPDILLADEPTGALDTTTSVQIMDLLKEVAEDRLVIMVTHNPELAEEYANRIVRLRDGELMDDSNPLTEEEIAAWEAATAAKTAERTQAKSKKAKKGKKEGKTSMSFSTAFGLSLNNLLTKKGRTVLTSFAGSIGIIGIALILSLSNGIQAYINQVQEDTLSSFPMSVQRETSDTSAMMNAMLSVKNTEDHSDEELIYVDDSMGTMMSAMASTVTQNLDDFKVYLDAHYDEIKDAVSDIQYTYALDLQVYNEDASVKLGLADMLKNMGGEMAGMSEMVSTAGMSGMDVMSEMIDNDELLDQQYEVVAGHWPENENEVVLVVSSNNQISKMTLYMLGVLPHDDLPEIMQKLMKDGKYEPAPIEPYS
ncbi:MAG: ABC transporter ATP-binding protein, partial [Clostridia bacterium]|nr:ABC transporter ATP-binding protein [Clostridia bacterium]